MEATTQTKERPILFGGPMVRALLAGAKTQTRRAVKPGAGQQWLGDKLALSPAARICKANYGGKFKFGAQFEHPISGPLTHVVCPYGQPGDRLWVRETMRSTNDGDDYAWYYAADGEPLDFSYETETGCDRADAMRPIKKPCVVSIHMPRAASRLLLEITAVRVERLIDISTADAIAEGIEPVLCPTTGTVPAKKWKNYLGRAYQDGMNLNYATESYLSLWNSINGADAHLANPWVWVVEFKVVSPIQD